MARLTVQCLSCKVKRQIPLAQGRSLKDLPLCPKDGGVMVVISVRM